MNELDLVTDPHNDSQPAWEEIFPTIDDVGFEETIRTIGTDWTGAGDPYLDCGHPIGRARRRVLFTTLDYWWLQGNPHSDESSTEFRQSVEDVYEIVEKQYDHEIETPLERAVSFIKREERQVPVIIANWALERVITSEEEYMFQSQQ